MPQRQEGAAGGRRCLYAVLLGLVVLSLAAPVAIAFDLDDVAAKAKQLAGEPYTDTRAQVPAWLLNITYDQWRDIRFRSDHALWRDRHLPFEVQFFHPGLY